MNPHYLYLTVDLAVLAIPLALSFDRKVRFVRFWPALFPAIAVMMALFIPWDVAFTEQGVWGFNPAYLSGVWIAGIGWRAASLRLHLAMIHLCQGVIRLQAAGR